MKAKDIVKVIQAIKAVPSERYSIILSLVDDLRPQKHPLPKTERKRIRKRIRELLFTKRADVNLGEVIGEVIKGKNYAGQEGKKNERNDSRELSS